MFNDSTSELMKDTMKRLTTFAKTVEDIHNNTKNSSDISSDSDSNNEPVTIPKKQPKQSILKIGNEPVDDKKSFEEFRKTMQDIIKFFDNQYTPLQILISIHKSAGDISAAVNQLSQGNVENDPSILTTIPKTSTESLKKYLS